jgi:tetrapyrrole methylase family protein / MazG family protein
VIDRTHRLKTDDYALQDLKDIMAFLRSPDGCPWDRVQSHETLRRHAVEEAYEVVDAVESGSPDRLRDELGDLLMQVVFHARIAEENSEFDFEDVDDGICRKLVTRHTHVFGMDEADSPEAVVGNWEKNKKNEKGLADQASVMEDVPRTLPALMRSEKVQQKARQVGFDWTELADVEAKVREEIEEIVDARLHRDAAATASEVGDLLFAVVNYARFLGVQPEMALNEATDRFIRRFRHVETAAADSGRELVQMTLAEMDVLWDQAKKEEKGKGQ